MNLKAIDAAIAAYRTNLDEGDVSRLAFFRELWGVQAEAASHVDLGYEVPDADSLKTWARHGEPVLSHAPVKIEAAALAGAMERLAEVLAARGGFAAFLENPYKSSGGEDEGMVLLPLVRGFFGCGTDQRVGAPAHPVDVRARFGQRAPRLEGLSSREAFSTAQK